MQSQMQIVKATLTAMLFTNVMRPVMDKAGLAGEYAMETFASLLAKSMANRHG